MGRVARVRSLPAPGAPGEGRVPKKIGGPRRLNVRPLWRGPPPGPARGVLDSGRPSGSGAIIEHERGHGSPPPWPQEVLVAAPLSAWGIFSQVARRSFWD